MQLKLMNWICTFLCRFQSAFWQSTLNNKLVASTVMMIREFTRNICGQDDLVFYDFGQIHARGSQYPISLHFPHRLILKSAFAVSSLWQFAQLPANGKKFTPGGIGR
jgi:hypothetical protein